MAETMDTGEAYVILGLPSVATWDEVKEAYHRLAHQHHPDKLSHLGPQYDEARANEHMLKLNLAYACLRKASGSETGQRTSPGQTNPRAGSSENTSRRHEHGRQHSYGKQRSADGNKSRSTLLREAVASHESALYSAMARRMVNQYRDYRGELDPKVVGIADRQQIRLLLAYMPMLLSDDLVVFDHEMEVLKDSLRSHAALGSSPLRLQIGGERTKVGPMALAHAYQIVEHFQEFHTLPYWWLDYDIRQNWSQNAVLEPMADDEEMFLRAPSTPGMRRQAQHRTADDC